MPIARYLDCADLNVAIQHVKIATTFASAFFGIMVNGRSGEKRSWGSHEATPPVFTTQIRLKVQ